MLTYITIQVLRIYTSAHTDTQNSYMHAYTQHRLKHIQTDRQTDTHTHTLELGDIEICLLVLVTSNLS